MTNKEWQFVEDLVQSIKGLSDIAENHAKAFDVVNALLTRIIDKMNRLEAEVRNGQAARN